MSEKVVIIGGGLTGLSAAWELEKRHIAYTLIEVKGRLGGSIISERRGGFVFDGGPMTFERTGDWSFLDELGLQDALYEVVGRGVQLNAPTSHAAFKDRTQTLTDMLAQRLTDTVMLRMAVTSLGTVGGQYTVCLENGLALTAGALI
ncbi:MAG: FAD-dependent oxidoreductase, partial [Burkholderiales bacterium]|nr:FAD-dependent oxidoreductase [Anaerolineae bacterium]